ncbi:MAG: L,D-transpeptidase family protein [Pseudomonadota bacterium]|nr:L,D-transpeptidase family protein [Pseudomonadota bacterium]
MKTGIFYTALAALLAQPGIAVAKPRQQPAAPAPVVLPYQSGNLPTSSQVRSFYAGWRYSPIWFNGTAAKPAARELLTVLQRAPLDGLSPGPQYATQVQVALQQAATGSPQAIAFAEHTLSEALVLYAQVMKRPASNYIFGYQHMAPKAPTADQVLRTAAGAPSLERYIGQLANPNSIYTGIRDAAWRQMQASGSMAADPRAVANLDRARIFPSSGRFVIVDSATQRLYMYENGVPVDSMKVVVGDKKELGLPTPMIGSMMYYVVHNPYWNVPHHLVRKLAPNLSKPSYLKAKGYEVMKDWTAASESIDPSTVDWAAIKAGTSQIRVRQKPSGENSMGDLKFPFNNSEDIFLHDTPLKQYFSYASRDLSNGCVRLEDARRFARWLLGHEPVKPSDGAEQFEQMRQGVPIYTTYLTAQVTDGQLAFVNDIYGWDPASVGGTQVAAGR